MSKFRFAVLASGEGSNLQALIDQVHLRGLGSLELVLSDTEGARALERARLASVPAVSMPPLPGEGRKAYHQRVAKALAAARPDLIVLAGYMRLLPPEFIAAMPPIINVHPSLLPAFPGLHAPLQALTYGVKITGCTVHLVDKGLDTGPIICQHALPVLPEDTADSLHRRIKSLEHAALVRAVKAIALGKVKFSGRKIELEEDTDGHQDSVNQCI